MRAAIPMIFMRFRDSTYGIPQDSALLFRAISDFLLDLAGFHEFCGIPRFKLLATYYYIILLMTMNILIIAIHVLAALNSSYSRHTPCGALLPAYAFSMRCSLP